MSLGGYLIGNHIFALLCKIIIDLLGLQLFYNYSEIFNYPVHGQIKEAG